MEELLLASRIDLGSVPLALDALDLADLCREAWTRVAGRGRGSRARRCSFDVQDDATTASWRTAPWCCGYSATSSRTPCATASPGSDHSSPRIGEADRLQITVTDEGPGVEEADLERLFEPFFRADRSRSRKTGAGGLGLMIVRRAVEAHGGSVEARRSDPQGLVVAFDLPVAPGPG